MVRVELLFVRHGYSCANAWKKKQMGLHWLYADPELTKEGIQLCEERRSVLESLVDSYFPGHSYTIGTSSMIRTQQTAYHMFLKGAHHKTYTIFPHIGEVGIDVSNFPLAAEKQRDLLGPSVTGHLDKDLRGSTNYYNKSNWPLFVKWLHHEGKHHLFKTDDDVYRAVLFSHGKFIRDSLRQPKANNNDVFFVRLDTETGDLLETKKCTEFPEPPTASVDGCRIHKHVHYLTGASSPESKTNTKTKTKKTKTKTRRNSRNNSSSNTRKNNNNNNTTHRRR